jgi:uncharacterized phage infection (PIP) family protein YhgE
MVIMTDTTPTTKHLNEAGIINDQLVEMPVAESEPAEEELSLVEVKKRRVSSGLLHGLSKLKPLLPLLSGGLRLIDHGAAQTVAHLLNLADTSGTTSAAVQDELHQGLAEIQSGHRELHLQVQDQAVGMQRIEEQITLLRQTTERHTTEHADLVDKVSSLNNLVRVMGVGLAILLVILITLVALLLTRHQ